MIHSSETRTPTYRHTLLSEEVVARLSGWIEEALHHLEEKQERFVTKKSLAGFLHRGRNSLPGAEREES